jgi:predicted secreted protein
MATKTGYINGSDILIKIGGKAVGHCTTHSVSYSAETKERAVKPVASASLSSSLWKGKGITALSVTISAEGLRNYDETEGGFKTLINAWKTAQSVQVVGFERESDQTPYLSGNFIIASMDETDPAQDDATYSISLENDGEITFTPSALTGEELS